MPTTITVTIPEPSLGPSDSFIVKYRLIGSPIWISVTPNPSNAPFDISGLADGEYEMSINILSDPSGPSVIRCFRIASDCNCPTISSQTLTQGNNINNLYMEIDTSTSGWPPCGLAIYLIDPTGTERIITIADPSSLTEIIGSPFVAGVYSFKTPVPGTSYLVQVYKNCCTGTNDIQQLDLCSQFTINIGGSPQDCIPIDLYPYKSFVSAVPDGSGNYYLSILVKINTTCDTLTVGWQEIYTYVTPDTGTHTVTGVMALPVDSSGYRTITVQVNPNSDDFGGYKYHASITDCCSVQHDTP